MMSIGWLPSPCRRMRKPTAISCAILCHKHETAAADKLWSHFIGLHKTVPAKAGFLYLDSLLEQHRVSDAVRTWRELAIISPEINSYLPQNGNLVVNPGFEQEILNGGFDWRITPLDKMSQWNRPRRIDLQGRA